MLTNIFDTHAHYNDEAFDEDRDALLGLFPAEGIDTVINCGTTLESSLACKTLADRYSFCYFAAGIHPEDCLDTDEREIRGIKELLADGKCAAIGEIGLDYHWDTVPKEKQIYVFEEQLKIASETCMPVIIHDREAHLDTLTLLKKYRPEGVMHCFSGSVETAKEILSLGMYIGLGGAVTFGNAKKAVEVAKMLPDDRILLETDCPYMAPVPFRGKRNDSRLIAHTAAFIAELRNTDPQKLIDTANENAKALFRKIK